MFFKELHVMILLPQLSWFVIFNTTILLKNWKLLICSVLNFYDVTEKDKHKYIVLRDRTLSRSGEEGREGLCRGHERQILKGHEIYFKIFDGSQKMFLCTSFLFFLFWVTSFKMFWRSEHKILKLAIKGTWKKNKAFLKISKIHLVIWQMLVKKIDVFWSCCCGSLHYDGAKDIYLYDKFS